MGGGGFSIMIMICPAPHLPRIATEPTKVLIAKHCLEATVDKSIRGFFSRSTHVRILVTPIKFSEREMGYMQALIHRQNELAQANSRHTYI